EEPVNVEPVKEVEPEPVVKRKAKKLEKKTDEYVSKFEKLAEVNKPAAKADTKKKKKKEEDDHKVRAKELLKDKEYDIRPVYSEEELEEIRLREEMELDAQYADDVDYDEYDEYYDDMD
ncbi:MAG: transcription termination/antitermination protein NusA, partial [Erysipelotrichaceae bacterium]|nr:transcription termination/antitermination protein NusA [Erysipelotrichaceae bacterium]